LFRACLRNRLPSEVWGGFEGKLSCAMLELIAPDFLERETFVCGSLPFMAAVREMLHASGFSMAHHHEESFIFEELCGAEQAVVFEAEQVSAPKVYRVEFAKTRRAIECPEGTSVLEVACRAEVRLPFPCTKGICGTCKSKLISGTVEM
jgi:glycine betaine catabolism B